MAARKRKKTDSIPDQKTPGDVEVTSTDPSWKIVAVCGVMLVIYLWLHADALRLLFRGLAAR